VRWGPARCQGRRRQAPRCRVGIWQHPCAVDGDTAKLHEADSSRELHKQINDAAASVVRNTCEGAGRWKPAEKVHKFEIAQGEASEAAGAVQSLLDLELGDSAIASEFLVIEARAAATLTGLIRKHRT